MNLTVLLVIFALGWAAVTGNFGVLNLLLGAAIGGLALLLFRVKTVRPAFLARAWRIGALALLFIRELLESAVRVAILVLTPNLQAKLHPAIIAFPLTAKTDGEITLLANLITLTPGTLSVDVSEDRQRLFIHCLSLKDRDALIAGIARGFEAKVIEVFK
jgi:multicomponent Na+:H+ antiporter subunit E